MLSYFNRHFLQCFQNITRFEGLLSYSQMKCDSPGFAVDLLNELVKAFLAAADTRSQVGLCRDKFLAATLGSRE